MAAVQEPQENYEYELDKDNKFQIVKSTNCNKKVYLRYVNRTERRINVIWIDYNGKKMIYKTLLPRQYFNVNTFATHPWIFKDSTNNERFAVMNRSIFRPRPTYEYCVKSQLFYLSRFSYNITVQLKDLKHLAMMAIMKLITVNDVDKLEIPKTLERELTELINCHKV